MPKCRNVPSHCVYAMLSAFLLFNFIVKLIINYCIMFKRVKLFFKDFFKFITRKKTHEEKMREYYNSDLFKRMESIKLYWTPALIEWIGRENNPITLAVSACLLVNFIYPSFMPSNPGDYRNNDDPILHYFISDLREMLKKKSEIICPGLHDKIRLSDYDDLFK